MTGNLASPLEYVADDRAIGYGSHDITNLETAIELVSSHIEARLGALLETSSQRNCLMLSGGIDSILLATYLAEKDPGALAVHFCIADDEPSRRELLVATGVAKQLGFEFQLIAPTAEQFGTAAQSVARDLGTADVWEVCAGAVLRFCDKYATAAGADGLIFTGAGADALFCGGKTVAEENWAVAVKEAIQAHFTYERNIPDFYERILARPERHVQFWQTHDAVELAQRLSPRVVRGEAFATDKWLFRELAQRRGVPHDWCFTTKDPMQKSSGAIRALERSARTMLAHDDEHSVYSNPLEEPSESIIGRLWLALGK